MENGLPASFELIHEPPYGLVVRWRGSVSAADLERSTRAVSADPSFDGLRYTIYDLRYATGRHESRDAAAIVNLAAQLIGESFTNPRIFRAWVGTDPELSRMFAELGSIDHLTFERFDDLSHARQWVQEQIKNSTGSYVALAS